jgi:hypothetical protein
MALGQTGSGSTLSNEVEDLEGILQKLKDNNTNLIKAKDVRDSVYSLWLKIEDNETTAPDVTYQNSTPVPVTVGGIKAGTTFNNPTDMQEMWDLLLQPYIPLASSLSINGQNVREFGNPSGLNTNSLTLNWNVTKNTNDITSITVDGQIITPTGDSQSGTKATTGTHSVIVDDPQEQNTFSMTSSDGDSTITRNTTLTWRNRIYWGRIDLSSLGNPNLTTSTASIPNISTLVTSSLVRSLNGAGVGNGNELSNSKNKSYDGINGAGQYLLFAFPSYLSGASNPTFTVNGLPNSAFTRIRTNWDFTNQYGFVTKYEVWISNTPQNSPIGTFRIS